MIPFIFEPTTLISNSFLPKLIWNYIIIILSQTNNNWSFSLGWAVQLINNRWLEAEGRPLLAPPRHGMTRQPANATEALPHHHSTSLVPRPTTVSVCVTAASCRVCVSTPQAFVDESVREFYCVLCPVNCVSPFFLLCDRGIYLDFALGLQVSLSNVNVILIWRA